MPKVATPQVAMPNPIDSSPGRAIPRFAQLIQELQVEFQLMQTALAHAQGLNSSAEALQAQVLTSSTAKDDARDLQNDSRENTSFLLSANGEDSEMLGLQQTSSVEIPPDMIEMLHDEFDALDTENEDRVPLQKVLKIVETYAQEPVDLDNLYSILSELLDHSKTPEAMVVSMTVAETDVQYMTFDDLLHMMAVPTNIPESENTGLVALAIFQKAFHNFAARTKELEQEQRRKKEQHDHLGVLLDVVPAPVIILNSIAMGIQADSADENLWKVIDVAFLVFYVCEAIVKGYFLSCRQYLCGPEKWWNWFDLLCIAISAFDIIYEVILPALSDHDDGAQVGELMLMKMLRLAKLARLVKALHYPFFEELKLMVNGVVSGMRVLLWAIVLLIITIFFLGVCLKNLVPQIDEFSTVPKAMFTVFRCFTDGCSAYDGTPLQEHLREDYGYFFVIPYFCVFMFVTFGLFNLIMAIFINNVQSTEEERLLYELGATSKAIKRKLEAYFVRKIVFGSLGKRRHLLDRKLRRECEQLYRTDPHLAYQKLPQRLEISGKMFDSWLLDNDLIRLLDEAEIQTSNVHDLFDVLDSDMSGQLTVVELVNGLMRLRGPITKSEMVAVRMKVRHITQEVHHMTAKICPGADDKEAKLDNVVSLEGLENRLSRLVSNTSSHK